MTTTTSPVVSPSIPKSAVKSNTNLMTASRQWATRPADERFATLEQLHTHCSKFRTGAVECDDVPLNTLRVKPVSVDGTATDASDLSLTGDKGVTTKFTNWSFGQLCRHLSAPAAYLATLPATTAAAAINFGLERADKDKHNNLLLYRNGSWIARAITDTSYDRIWNSDITSRMFSLREKGWMIPPARPVSADQPGARIATEADCVKQDWFRGEVKPGDIIAPAGLYASDRDMFAFFINPKRELTAGGAHLFRGIFLENSEVGDKSFRVTRFLFNNVCSNHIIWSASDVITLAVRHVGNAAGRAWSGLEGELTKYSDASADVDCQRIVATTKYMLGTNKDEVLNRLFGLDLLPRKVLTAAYDRAVECVETDALGCSPNSAWGYVQGLTRVSQDCPFADTRSEMDKAAGKVLKMAF